MHTNDQRSFSLPRPVRWSLSIGLLLLLAVNLTPASAVAAPTPQLSIAVDDGRASTAAGETLTYTVTVRNLGATPISGLQVTQTMPSGLSFLSGDSAGVATASTVTWHLDLAAAGTTTMHTTMSVSATPTELLRLATVACASVGTTASPIVCGSDSDLLPAGRRAAASRPVRGSAAAASSNGRWYGIGIGGAILMLVGLAALMAGHRRRLALE
ncbi:MAG: DUF11 domain-containing protein [Actinomycetota bacterium]|nr:DUF11 domain-containing protein [Actinomycetota bacterium]